MATMQLLHTTLTTYNTATNTTTTITETRFETSIIDKDRVTKEFKVYVRL